MIALLLLGCRGSPSVRVVGSTDLGPIETTPAVKGRDGGYSVAFGGRTVWLYGDTILSVTGEDGSSWRDNSWSWSTDLDGTDGFTGFTEPVDALGAPAEFFPETAEEAAYNRAHAGDPCEVAPCGAREVLWPMAAAYDPANDRVLAFYEKIHGEPGAWNFFARGYGVAVWDDPDGAPVRMDSGPDDADPTLLFLGDADNFGDAALVDGGWVYAYACGDEGGWGKPCRVARVGVDDVLDRAAWRFWDGGAWSPEIDDAKTVFEGNSQLTVHRSELAGGFVAIHVDGVSRRIGMRTAPAPEGPWSRATTLFRALPAYDDAWVYCGLGHAELQRDGGRVEVVSYYRGTGDWTGEVRLVEVELDAR